MKQQIIGKMVLLVETERMQIEGILERQKYIQMTSAERKNVVHNTYQPMPNVAEIILFCSHVFCFLCVCMMGYYPPKSMDGNARTKLLLKNRTRMKQQHDNMDIETYIGITNTEQYCVRKNK